MTENLAELILAVTVLIGFGLAVTFRPRRACADAVERRSHPRLDLELWMLALLSVATLVLMPVLDAAVPWFEFADSRFRTALAWLGAGFGASALVVFWCGRRDLGGFAGQPWPVPAFMDVGVYRFVRHPLYTALLLWALAQCLLSQNWLSGPLAVITFLVLYWLRVPRDEQTLLERFGHRYLEYMERTGSLLPRLPGPRRR